MRRGLDTNVLVYAHLPALREHAQVRGFLLGQLRRPNLTLAITPAILHEFVHVVTDRRTFEPPVEMSEALAIARLYLGRTNVECLVTDEQILLEAFALLEQYALGRHRVADTLFAATLLHYGVHELITCNPGEFRIFAGLSVIDPREGSPSVTS